MSAIFAVQLDLCVCGTRPRIFSVCQLSLPLVLVSLCVYSHAVYSKNPFWQGSCFWIPKPNLVDFFFFFPCSEIIVTFRCFSLFKVSVRINFLSLFLLAGYLITSISHRYRRGCGLSLPLTMKSFYLKKCYSYEYYLNMCYWFGGVFMHFVQSASMQKGDYLIST